MTLRVIIGNQVTVKFIPKIIPIMIYVKLNVELFNKGVRGLN